MIEMSGQDGFCAKPYIYHNTKMLRKLGWLHIAAMKDRALAGRLNQEDIAEFDIVMDQNLSEAQKQMQRLELRDTPLILSEHQQKISY